MEVMACAKFAIGAIFSFWASLGTPYAAAVQALPWATSALTHGAPSIRTKASRWPPESITAKDIARLWSAAAARQRCRGRWPRRESACSQCARNGRRRNGSVVLSAGRTVNPVCHHGPEPLHLGCRPGGTHCGEDAVQGGKSDVK